MQRDLSIVLQREARTICLGAMVTVTTVRMSPDLGVAKVYVSIFAVGDKNAAFENIKAGTSKIRGFLGKMIGKDMRRMPELHFYLDDTLDYVENIDKILGDIKPGDPKK